MNLIARQIQLQNKIGKSSIIVRSICNPILAIKQYSMTVDTFDAPADSSSRTLVLDRIILTVVTYDHYPKEFRRKTVFFC